MTHPFTLGVNYWPRRKAMYWWGNFDAGEVREEFALIRELGLKVVRFFLLWDDFQPRPDMVDAEQLANLITVADIAAENSLLLNVTFFTGHMSGFNWSPGWLLDRNSPPSSRDVVSGGKLAGSSYRNMFTDSVAIEAEKLLLKTVVNALKDHPAIWMWNLGNEPDIFARPLDYKAGRAWVHEIVGLIREIDPNHLINCGLHIDSLHRDNGLRIDQVFAETDVAVMHSYPMYSNWARHALDPDFVPFTCALTAALCGKPVLMEEFGGCTAQPGQSSYIMEWQSHGRDRKQFMASEEDLAEFIRQTLPRLQASGATGAFLWCYADYIPELWGLPPCTESPHERFFGLVRPDGSIKPHARVIQEFAATNPQILPLPDYARINIDPDIFYQDPQKYLTPLYEQYLAGLNNSTQ